MQQAPARKHDFFDKLPVEFWNTPMAAQPDTSQRLGFLQLDGDAVQALREIAPLVSQALPGVLAAVYVHMRKWPQVSAHVSGETMMDKAKNS